MRRQRAWRVRMTGLTVQAKYFSHLSGQAKCKASAGLFLKAVPRLPQPSVLSLNYDSTSQPESFVLLSGSLSSAQPFLSFLLCKTAGETNALPCRPSVIPRECPECQRCQLPCHSVSPPAAIFRRLSKKPGIQAVSPAQNYRALTPFVARPQSHDQFRLPSCSTHSPHARIHLPPNPFFQPRLSRKNRHWKRTRPGRLKRAL